jgi:hypothetical protein
MLPFHIAITIAYIASFIEMLERLKEQEAEIDYEMSEGLLMDGREDPLDQRCV